MTYTLTKLSEVSLGDCITALFNVPPTAQHRIKYAGRVFVVDYFLQLQNRTFMFEFDGPTHYTKPKTQQRDCLLKRYCAESDITLVQIPYFVQFNDNTVDVLFGTDTVCEYNLKQKVITEYKTGFWDAKCVLPGEFNPHGISRFVSEMNQLKECVESEFQDMLASISQFEKFAVCGVEGSCVELETLLY